MSTSSLEDTQKRHDYLRAHEMIFLSENMPSIATRIRLKLINYPVAIYFHLFDGTMRKALGLAPKVFKFRTDKQY